MPSSSYTPTTWVNNSAPNLNAPNLGHMEGGIEDAHERIDNLESVIGSATLVADAKLCIAGGISAGSLNHYAAFDANFATTDVGKSFAISDGAKSLTTTISSRVSATEVILATPAPAGGITGRAVYGTDNTAAINALIFDGAEIRIDGGVLCTGEIDVIGHHGVSFRGGNGLAAVKPMGDATASNVLGLASLPRSCLIYVGVGSSALDAFISGAHSSGLQFTNCGIVYMRHDIAADMLVDLHGDADPDTQTHHPSFIRCTIGCIEPRANNACNLVELGRSWSPSFYDCDMIGGVYQFAVTQGGFCNNLNVHGGRCFDYRNAIVWNPCEATSFTSTAILRGYDPAVAAAANVLRFVDTDGSRTWDGFEMGGLFFSDCDPGVAAHTVIKVHAGPGLAAGDGFGGLNIHGCRGSFRAAQKFIEVASDDFRAIYVHGNSFGYDTAFCVMIDFGTPRVGVTGGFEYNTDSLYVNGTCGGIAGTIPPGFGPFSNVRRALKRSPQTKSTSVAPDAELTLPVRNGEKIKIDATAFFTSSADATDMGFALNVSGSPVDCRWFMLNALAPTIPSTGAATGAVTAHTHPVMASDDATAAAGLDVSALHNSDGTAKTVNTDTAVHQGVKAVGYYVVPQDGVLEFQWGRATGAGSVTLDAGTEVVVQRVG